LRMLIHRSFSKSLQSAVLNRICIFVIDNPKKAQSSYTSPSPTPIKLKECSTYTRIPARCQTNNRELVLFKP
ncbi:hypothetical protein T4B_4924, partial [Trichinella pseudospiralis]